jgi:uncharacterized protein (DUF1800 family)
VARAGRPPGEGPETGPPGAAAPLGGAELITHLLRRAGFGATPAELKRALAQGYERTVEDLLDVAHVQESPVLAEDILYRYLPDAAAESRGPEPFLIFRMVNTRQPLREKMALFWHGLFATARSKVRTFTMVTQFEMFRQHALDRFPEILLALSRDPAMILWLDNKDSTKNDLNENYGRELLELFSMGIGNYAEADVKAAARAFTGWTIKNFYPVHPFGYFEADFDYRDEQHDHGEKTFLGQTGPWNGEDIIRIIVRQPATARFVAAKLHAFFVSDEPDADEIARIAGVFARTGGDMRRVLRALFLSDFFRSERHLNARVKMPTELVVGTARLSGAYRFPAPGLERLSSACSYMGQDVLNPPSVKGWDGGQAWISSGLLMERINFAAQEIGDLAKPGVQAFVDGLAATGEPVTPELAVDRALAFMGLLRAAPETRQALLQHVRRDGDLCFAAAAERQASAERVAELLLLLAASCEYQFA